MTTSRAINLHIVGGSPSSLAQAVHDQVAIRKESLTITHADLTDDVDGEAQAITVGTLPTGAVVLFSTITLTTQFTGGSVSAVAVDLGWSGSTEILMKDFDALGSAASGAVYDTGATAVAYLPRLASAKTILATFTPDGGHDVEDLTAGSLTVDVYYVVRF